MPLTLNSEFSTSISALNQAASRPQAMGKVPGAPWRELLIGALGNFRNCPMDKGSSAKT